MTGTTGPHLATAAPVARLGGRALVKVGTACNQDCSFCHASAGRGAEASAAEVTRKIARAASLGHEMVILSGGEPTLRPELLPWAEEAGRLGLGFGLVTNGTALADEALVEALLERGLAYVHQSIHGSTAEIHGLVTGKETFEAAWRAARNLAGRVGEQTLQFVVTRQNLDDADAFVDRTLDFSPAAASVKVKFSMVFARGEGEARFEEVTPRLSEAAGRVRAAILRGRAEVARRGTPGPRFVHDGFPLCLLPGLEDSVDDLRANAIVTMSEAGEPDLFAVDSGTRVQPEEACGPCGLRGLCPGICDGYRARRGTSEISAVPARTRANSFNYVFREVVGEGVPDAECPLRDGPLGVAPWDSARQLFVRHRGRVGRYLAASRDFGDAEVAAVKHATGQLYLDASRKDAPDDFARDLVPLRRSALCGPCPERERCTGLFEPLLAPNLFEEGDARVREILAGLEGDVLDLGCGNAPYGDAIGPRALAGRARYTGLDPDGEALSAARERRPWARLVRGAAEDLDGLLAAGETFDHVLVLRSWNHFERPARVLSAVARRLRPGGTILLVDNVAFGLARTGPQARRGEGSAARQEHFRNDGAGEALRVAAPFGWKLLEREDVRPETGNQWLLRLCAG